MNFKGLFGEAKRELNRAGRRAEIQWEKGAKTRARKAIADREFNKAKEARAARELKKVEAGIKRRAEKAKLKDKQK